MRIIECFLVIFILIVVIRVVNEKFIHMQGDIALVLFSSLICAMILAAGAFAGNSGFSYAVNRFGRFGFSEYLLDGVLCFMLFSISCITAADTLMNQDMKKVDVCVSLTAEDDKNLVNFIVVTKSGGRYNTLNDIFR